MFEMLSPCAAPAAAFRKPLPVAGRRDDTDTPLVGTAGGDEEWLAATLDEIDYGVLLVARDGGTMHANHAARAELGDAVTRSSSAATSCRCGTPATRRPFRDALHSALRRGLRRLLSFGEGDTRCSVSVVPLRAQGGDRRAAALLLLGKRRVCEDLSVQGYARDHGLTPAEGRVLAALCGGRRPNEVAAESGVAISTVRTQIGSIRAKTGADSIRSLVRTVATLPPLMGALLPRQCPAAWRVERARRRPATGAQARRTPRPRLGAASPGAFAAAADCRLPACRRDDPTEPSRPTARAGAPRHRAPLSKGTVLIHEGDQGSSLFIILSGRVRAYGTGSGGRELTYGIYGPGEYLGEMGLDGGPRSANVGRWKRPSARWSRAATL